MYSGITPTRPIHNTPDPNYSMITTDDATYETTDLRQHEANTPRPGPANPTPVRGKASKKGDDFFAAGPHEYALVNTDKKGKTEGEVRRMYDIPTALERDGNT